MSHETRFDGEVFSNKTDHHKHDENGQVRDNRDVDSASTGTR